METAGGGAVEGGGVFRARGAEVGEVGPEWGEEGGACSVEGKRGGEGVG